MAYYSIDHAAAPFPAIVEAFDMFDAARKYKRALERAQESEMIDGDVLTISSLEGMPVGEALCSSTMLCYWENIKNFKVLEA